MRTVILHYHLFKNAGTSVDQILRHNFPDGWDSREFPGQGGDNSSLVRDWILERPDCLAFSSHTMLGPLPRADGLNLVPIVLLRDPVDRILSAYQFERHQQAQTKGAILAKKTSLTGYVRARLDMPGDRQCRNFQTARLASHVPGRGSELERARAALEEFRESGIVGLVREFDRAMKDLAQRLEPLFGPLKLPPTRANLAKGPRPRIAAATRALLEQENAADFELLAELQAQRPAA